MASRVPAAVLREVGGALRVEEITLPEPGPGQVRVRLAATGVCHSDLSLARGTLAQPLPVVLGHEGAGRVAAVGDRVTGLAPGDPVVLNWAPACRDCWWCRAGEPWLCERATRAWQRPYARLADGTEVYPGLGTAAFAAETVVAADACVRLPEDIPLTEAALLGCAVQTGVGAVRNSARVRPGESVVVIGLGGVGLAAVQGARLAGADPIIAVDPVESKGELARRVGATHLLAPGNGLSRRVRELVDGRGADHAFECVGRSDTIRAGAAAGPPWSGSALPPTWSASTRWRSATSRVPWPAVSTATPTRRSTCRGCWTTTGPAGWTWRRWLPSGSRWRRRAPRWTGSAPVPGA
jgi:S-(hydroxymethyl)glutathione dehydrogenase/alcohol dehydrogenase